MKRKPLIRLLLAAALTTLATSAAFADSDDHDRGHDHSGWGNGWGEHREHRHDPPDWRAERARRWEEYREHRNGRPDRWAEHTHYRGDDRPSRSHWRHWW